MRVVPSQPSDLYRDGASIRVYRDTHRKLKQLAARTGVTMAVMVDRLVDQELQRQFDIQDQQTQGTHPSQE